MIPQTLVLDQNHVARIIRTCGRDEFMDRMIIRLRNAFAVAARSGAITPAREGFRRCDQDSGVLEWMPHHDPGKSITIKTVAYTPSNPTRHGLPTILGTIARFDDVTGHLGMIADGVLLTAIRTGAASAVATELLAAVGSKVVGIVGAGAQAVTQLHALSRVLRIEEVLVFDTEPCHSATLAARIGFLDLRVKLASIGEIEASCDVICTVTTVAVGGGPVLRGTNLLPHVHINAVGADLPGKTEIPVAVLKSAFVCPDHLGQARREGECQQLFGHGIGQDLPTLCANPQLAYQHRARSTVFDSTGFALEDHVALDVLGELAAEYGIGELVHLEHIPDDPLDPYSDSRVDAPADSTGDHTSLTMTRRI